MTGEVEVVAWQWRYRCPLSGVWHKWADGQGPSGAGVVDTETRALVPASALEALRADNERLAQERDEDHRAFRIAHDQAMENGIAYQAALARAERAEAEIGRVRVLVDHERAERKQDAAEFAALEASLAGRDAEIAKAVAGATEVKRLQGKLEEMAAYFEHNGMFGSAENARAAAALLALSQEPRS